MRTLSGFVVVLDRWLLEDSARRVPPSVVVAKVAPRCGDHIYLLYGTVPYHMASDASALHGHLPIPGHQQCNIDGSQLTMLFMDITDMKVGLL